jgi:DNA-binding transcriptional MerR regulator
VVTTNPIHTDERLADERLAEGPLADERPADEPLADERLAEGPVSPQQRLRVEQLAAAAGVAVDTIRYYQKLGLLPPPERAGRVAHYGPGHLERLARIRRLADAGFSLSQIADSLDTAAADPVLARLVDRQVGSATVDRQELTRRSGLEPDLVALAVDSGLLRPLPGGDVERFSEDVLPMLEAARELLEAGLPTERLAAIGVEHARHVEDTVEQAIAVFRDAVHTDPGSATELVDRLVPAVTRLVADHFERTLVEHAAAHLSPGDGAVPAAPRART